MVFGSTPRRRAVQPRDPIWGKSVSDGVDPTSDEVRRSKAKPGQQYCNVPGCGKKTLRANSKCLDCKVETHELKHNARRTRSRAKQQAAQVPQETDRDRGDAV